MKPEFKVGDVVKRISTTLGTRYDLIMVTHSGNGYVIYDSIVFLENGRHLGFPGQDNLTLYTNEFTEET